MIHETAYKNINVRAMQVMKALYENDFNAGKASLDLNSFRSNVNMVIVQIKRNSPFEIFTYGPPNRYSTKPVINGFTEKGKILAAVSTEYLTLLDELSGRELNTTPTVVNFDKSSVKAI